MADIKFTGKSATEDRMNMSLSKLLDLEVKKNANNKGEVAAVKKLLALDTIDLGDGKITTLLDMTPMELKGQGNLLKDIFVEGNLAAKGKPAVLKSVVRLNAVFEGAGLSQRGGYLSTLLEKEVGKEAYENASGWSKRRARKIIEELPDNFYKKVPSVIANLDGEAKNLASVMFLGGFRPSDLDGLAIDQINFTSGVINDAQTKSGKKTIILSDPILDILRVQKGNRTSEPLFANIKDAQKTINANLKIAFPEGVQVYKPNKEKYVTENITSYNFRNANEALHVELGTPESERRIATGRAGVDEGAGYVTNRTNRIKVTQSGNKISAKVAAYTGVNSVSQLLGNLGYDNISEKTSKIAVTQDLLFDEVYTGQLVDGFKESLPATGNELSAPATVDLNQSDTVKSIGQADADEYVATKELSAAEKRAAAQKLNKEVDALLKEPKKLSKKLLDLLKNTKIGKPLLAVGLIGAGSEFIDTEAAPFDLPDALSPIGLEPSPVASEMFEMRGYNPEGYDREMRMGETRKDLGIEGGELMGSSTTIEEDQTAEAMKDLGF